jgi:hypothetical protein
MELDRCPFCAEPFREGCAPTVEHPDYYRSMDGTVLGFDEYSVTVKS